MRVKVASIIAIVVLCILATPVGRFVLVYLIVGLAMQFDDTGYSYSPQPQPTMIPISIPISSAQFDDVGLIFDTEPISADNAMKIEELGMIPSQGRGLRPAVISPNGRWVVVLNEQMFIYDLAKDIETAVYTLAAQNLVQDFIFSPDSQQLALIQADGTLQVYSITDFQLLYETSFTIKSDECLYYATIDSILFRPCTAEDNLALTIDDMTVTSRSRILQITMMQQTLAEIELATTPFAIAYSEESGILVVTSFSADIHLYGVVSE